MKRTIFFNIILILLFSCSRDNTDEININRDSDSIICYDSIFKDGYSNRYCEKYYASGELMETYFSKDDSIINGPYKSYHKNGNLKDSCYYSGGYIYGWSKSFYSNGNKKNTTEYTIFDTEFSYRNQFAEFDSITGEINYETCFFYTIELTPKNIREGDSLSVLFYFNCPMYEDTSYLEIGDYDEFFSISNVEETRKVPVVNKVARFKMKVVKKNRNFVRGIVHNFNQKDSSEYRKFYFSRRYYVE